MSGTIVHCFPALCIMFIQFTLCFYPLCRPCLGTISAVLPAVCSRSAAVSPVYLPRAALQHCTHCTHQAPLLSQSSSRLVLLWHWVILSTLKSQLHPYRIRYYAFKITMVCPSHQLLKVVILLFSLGGAGAGLGGIMACIFCYRLLVSGAQGAAGHNLDNGGSSGTRPRWKHYTWTWKSLRHSTGLCLGFLQKIGSWRGSLNIHWSDWHKIVKRPCVLS